jgi:transketolase
MSVATTRSERDGRAITRSEISRLEGIAAQLRVRLVRMMGQGKAHHFGGSLSAADLVTALYFHKMNYDPENPGWPERDRFVMSKGHSVPIQYAALATLGVFPVDELRTLKKLGSRLQGHPAMQHTPGVEACTGSLGQGLSYANGLALAGRLHQLDYRVYCLVGDGELHEGQVWEAAMTSPKHRLTNLTLIIDKNGLKASDATASAKPLEPLAKRFTAFGWAVREIDGHDMGKICRALDWASAQTEAPSAIVACTVKGKGVSFMENQAGFHNAALTPEQYEQALTELEAHLRLTGEAA